MRKRRGRDVNNNFRDRLFSREVANKRFNSFLRSDSNLIVSKNSRGGLGGSEFSQGNPMSSKLINDNLNLLVDR